MYRSLRHALLCIATLVLTSLHLQAQTTGTLAGRIIDPDGRPVQGATIRVVGTMKGAISKADGGFLVAGIRAGEYEVSITAIGYETVRLRTRIDVNQTTTISSQFATSPNTLSLTFRSDDPHIGVPFAGTVIQGQTLHIRVFRVVDPAEFILSHRDLLFSQGANGSLLVGGGSRMNLENQGVFRFVKEWDHTPAFLHGNNTMNETIPLKIRKSGIYLVEISLSPQSQIRTLATVAISDLTLITKQGDDGLLVYAVDAATGRRAADVELTYGCDTSNLMRTSTRWDGTARLAPRPDAACLYLPLLLASRRGDVAIAELPKRGASSAPLLVHLQTDRPLYRPNQVVYYRGICRWPDANGNHRPLPSSDVSLIVRDPQGKIVSQTKHTFSDLGTFSGELCLGAECPLGSYTASVWMNGVAGGSFNFEVAEYKKPEYEVTVSAPREHYRMGEKITATVRGRYFFGAPVAGAEVEYMIIRTPLGGETASNYRMMGKEELIHTAKGRLAGDGTFTIDYPIGASLTDDYRYRIQATVTDASRRAITGMSEVMVTRTEYATALGVEKSFYRVGDLAEASLVVSRFDRRDAGAMRYMITATRRFLERAGDTTVEQSERIWTKSGVTDAAGRADISYKVTREGSIELKVEIAGEPAATGTAGFMAINEDGEGSAIPCTSVLVIPERKLYEAGATMSALVVLPEESMDLLVTAEAGIIISSDVKRIQGRAAIVEIPLTRSHAPNFQLAVAAVARGKAYMRDIPVEVFSPEKTIFLEIDAGKRSFKPGDSATIMVRALDRSGKPVRNADLALAAVDESIFSLSSDKTPGLAGLVTPHRTHTIATQYASTSFPLLIMNGGYHNVVMRANQIRSQAITVTTERVQSARSTTSSSGFSIRGGRATETSIQVDGVETANSLGSTQGAPEKEVRLVDAQRMVPGYALPKLRTTFRDLMAWAPSLRTDANGYARLAVRFPDNLTTWRVTVRGITAESEAGETRVDLIARKDLLVRMETPRFVTQGDSLLIATTIHNYLSTPKRVTVRLSGENASIGGMERTVTVGANEDARVDWPLTATTADTIRLRARALTDEESDAVETSLPVMPRGLHRKVNALGAIAPEEKSAELTLRIPAESAGDTRSLTVMLSPTVASTMIGALDDLIGYSYGCAEQTMTRFLPTVVVANTLKRLHTEFDADKLRELPKMVEAGLTRLYGFQHADGGWGWWENDATNPFMTAYIMYGLTIAKQAGFTVPEDRYRNGMASLRAQVERAMPDGGGVNGAIDEATLAYMLFVSSITGVDRGDRFYRDRIATLVHHARTSNYALALLSLAARYHDDARLADSLTPAIVNILNSTKENAQQAAASHTGRWQTDPVEATSYAISALLAARHLSDPVEEGVSWLLKQRRGSSWLSTRQTAMAIYALSDYIGVKGQSGYDYDIVVRLNGEQIYEKHIDMHDAVGSALEVTVRGEKVLAGANTVTVEKRGGGSLQVSAWSDYYTDGADARAFDAGFDVKREYFTLHRELRGDRYIYTKKPFEGTVKSGDELLVKVTIGTDVVRDYFLLEDPLPAGCEVMTDVTGYTIEGEDEYRTLGLPTDGRWRWWYSSRDVRDEKIAFFATQLKPGTYQFSYILHAQIPGRYDVMPSLATLNYFPEVHGNSASQRMMILE